MHTSPENTVSLRLGFVGDFCLSGAERSPPILLESLMAQSQILNDKVDLAIANFEFSIATVEQKKSYMSFPLSQSDQIKNSGFDVFCLANNHVKDHGEQTLLHTLDTLAKHHFKTVGAGRDLASAQAPLIVEINSKRIGILNVTDATHYRATQHRAGVAPLSKHQLTQSIKTLREKVDLIVISIHADLEFTNLPAPWKVNLSRYLVRQGADLIIHHHPHTLQGIEEYQGAIIAYSLGNFIFPVPHSRYMDNRPGNVEHAIYLTINAQFIDNKKVQLSYEIIPTKINPDMSITIVEGEEKAAILSNIEQYSQQLKQQKLLINYHRRRCNKEFRALVLGAYYSGRKYGIMSLFNYLKIHLTTDQHLGWLRGFFSGGRY